MDYHGTHEIPEEDSVWEHRNGGKYRVMFVTNLENRDPAHLPDVVYCTLNSVRPHYWSRRLYDWSRSMKRVP